MHYLQHLQTDDVLAHICTPPLPALTIQKNVGIALIRSILGQQLSTTVANILYQRFLALFPQKPTCKAVMALPFNTLKGIGLSNNKTQYVINVATFFVEQKLTDAWFNQQSNEAIVEKLTQIKGVGKWTVEMILMFTLGREDVFAVDDLGIQKAMCKLYQIPADIPKKQMQLSMLEISKQWQPFRTYACLHLWKWKDS
ncbi:MAG: DNA-3-methyladenine glycosylase 2 family protein [Bacteroidetes bacterium]|nr:MAG: DNA-3-methyladenine glycosylase 2 family protein [Bacteroidota bacterium]TAE72695.1 MAG: DNA-3-methyladenine glycosylase 2 family protein [Bacteroidota bacterium]TAF97311.1 MAG: DNA-3-methyladenine glycosylase 2 family protein [Bacteroidota bacterium]